MATVRTGVTDADAVASLVRVSRDLGSRPRLVLHGGGNTSLKTAWRDLTGREVPVLLVKGSGHDLATIAADGFAPLRLDRVRELLPPVIVPPDDLASELRCALLRADAPDPSVETLVHALLDEPVVLHSHADALLVLSHAPQPRDRLGAVLGEGFQLCDYAMPGPELVAALAGLLGGLSAEQRAELRGVMVLDHGLFTVGRTADEALRAQLEAVERAEAALPASRLGRGGHALPGDPLAVARLRREVSDLAGRPLLATRTGTPAVADFVADPALLRATAEGPLTPDHATWTGRIPLAGTSPADYASAHEAYVAEGIARRGFAPEFVDHAPRVVLDPGLGLLAFGRTARETGVVTDLYLATMDGIDRAENLGGYQGVEAGHVFDLEYWPAQQQKLRRALADAPPLTGQVALVTGAASGIGRACASALLAAGAAVIGLDLNPAVARTFDGPSWTGLAVDVTDGSAVRAALATGVDSYGGVDIVVLAAGIFPGATPLAELGAEEWRRVQSINVDSAVMLLGAVHPYLALAPGGGRVVVIASKNVPAPGPGAAAYSASKAALTQLGRVAALEWAGEGIRLNLIHPDAVFDTGLWTPDLLAARAQHYGMSVEDYKRRNLLKTEVGSADVAALCVAMATAPFRCTTGAQVPVDGGNERVI